MVELGSMVRPMRVNSTARAPSRLFGGLCPIPGYKNLLRWLESRFALRCLAQTKMELWRAGRPTSMAAAGTPMLSCAVATTPNVGLSRCLEQGGIALPSLQAVSSGSEV